MSTKLALALAAFAVAGILPWLSPPAGAAAERRAASLGELVLPDELVVGVEFPRYLQVERRLETIIDNQSDVDVTVIDVALRSPLFEPVDADEHDYIVASGRRQDFQMGGRHRLGSPAWGSRLVSGEE